MIVIVGRVRGVPIAPGCGRLLHRNHRSAVRRFARAAAPAIEHHPVQPIAVRAAATRPPRSQVGLDDLPQHDSVFFSVRGNRFDVIGLAGAMAKQPRRFRNFSPNTPGYLGPKSSTNANNVEVYSQKRGWVPLKSLPDKPQSPRKLPAKTVHRRPRKAAPPAPARATTSALVQLGTTLQALGAQLVNSVVDCAV